MIFSFKEKKGTFLKPKNGFAKQYFFILKGKKKKRLF